jgi:hypothetical protein
MDLELIYQDPNIAGDLETKLGVKRGIAWPVVGDVGHWPRSTNKIRHRIKQSKGGNCEEIIYYYIAII